MPRTKISEFSATPGNNTDIDGINLAEGCAPSGINDAIRELMAQLKDFQAGTAGDSFNGPVGTTTPAAGAFTNLSASGTFALTGDQVQISEGGTGQTTANAAFNALAPSQTSQSGKYLKTDGTNTSWDAIDINTADITGTLPIANGGSGQTTANAALNAFLPSQASQSGKYLKTDGTNASWDQLDISTADITGTLPIANGGTGLTALGTGVQTALGIAVGSSGAFVTNGGALGTPSSGTVTNLTGTASININGTVGATTPTTGAFTTLSASGNITVSGGTANGVAYLNGSKVLTTGSALTFSGGVFGVSDASSPRVSVEGSSTASGYLIFKNTTSGLNRGYVGYEFANDAMPFAVNGSEAMRLTSTGLGIGTSLPGAKLQVDGANVTFDTNAIGQVLIRSTTAYNSTPRAGIGFSVNYNSGGAQTAGGCTIQSYKENATDGDFGTGLLFTTQANGLAPSEKLRLDSSGNLGLGVTPSAGTSGKVFQITNAGHFMASGPTVYIDANAYFDSGWKYITTAAASNYYQNSGAHIWQTAPSGTAGNAISFTQAMTLDASGNLVVGGTSANVYGASKAITLNATSGQSCVYEYTIAGTSTGYFGGSSTATWVGSKANIPLVMYTNDTERARITSGGDLLVGTTNASASAGSGLKVLPVGNGTDNPQIAIVTAASTNSTASLSLYSTGAAAYRFYVADGGTVYATSTSISGISDQRFKENIVDLDVGLNAVMALKPRKFDWKSGKGKDIKGDRGFIAQEFEQVFPDLIDEWKDPAPEGEEPYKSVRQDLIPVLVKAIQEQQAIITDLRARVAQLEAK